jgi:AcrR family transcriptional regulator
VSAVYRYFPNKETVLRTLAERIIAEWDSWFDGFEQDLEDCGDPVQLWCASIDHFYTRIQTLPGAMAIRRAMQISPELRELDRQDNTLLATRLAQTLSNYYAHLTLAQAKVIAVVLMETAVPIIDQALASSPAQGKKLLAELKRMHSGYISECTRPW